MEMDGLDNAQPAAPMPQPATPGGGSMLSPNLRSALNIPDIKQFDLPKAMLANKEAGAQLSARQKAERAPLEKGIMDTMEAQKKTLEQGAQQVPLKDAPHFEPAKMNDAFSAIMVLAAIAGSASRQPLTASLNFMTGALKGLKEGNQQEFERNYKEWDANFKKGVELQKQYNEKYKNIIENQNVSITQRKEMLRQLSVEHGDQRGLELLDHNDFSSFIKEKADANKAVELAGWNSEVTVR